MLLSSIQLNNLGPWTIRLLSFRVFTAADDRVSGGM